MPSGAHHYRERATADVVVLAHRLAFIRHSQALGMNGAMPHAAWRRLD